MIDAGGSRPFWTLHFKDALERAKMLADYGIAWFEEPLAADDMEGYVRLTDSSPVKISHCEVFTRRQSFVPYFTRRAMDIVVPARWAASDWSASSSTLAGESTEKPRSSSNCVRFATSRPPDCAPAFGFAQTNTRSASDGKWNAQGWNGRILLPSRRH